MKMRDTIEALTAARERASGFRRKYSQRLRRRRQDGQRWPLNRAPAPAGDALDLVDDEWRADHLGHGAHFFSGSQLIACAAQIKHRISPRCSSRTQMISTCRRPISTRTAMNRARFPSRMTRRSGPSSASTSFCNRIGGHMHEGCTECSREKLYNFAGRLLPTHAHAHHSFMTRCSLTCSGSTSHIALAVRCCTTKSSSTSSMLGPAPTPATRTSLTSPRFSTTSIASNSP